VPVALLVLAAACTTPAAPAKPAGKPGAAPAGQAAGATDVRREGPSITFKFASPSPEADLSGVGYKHWAKLVGDRTGGRIKFQFFWAGSLLPTQQMFQGIRDGLSDFGGPAMSYVSGQIPDVALFEVPFAYPTDTENTIEFMRSVEPILNDIFQGDFNQRLVWASPATTADPVSCRDRFLDTEQAWQGALVRTAGKWQARTLEVWGAKPVVIPLGDAYTAIQRGTAECLLLVYNLVDSFKFYEVAKYLTRIDHSINLAAVTVNLDAWNRLPPEDQQILLEAGREAQDYVLKERDQLVTQVIEKFKREGVRICTPSQAELQRLRSATEQVLDEIAGHQTEKGRQIQDIAREFRARVKQIGPTEGDMTPCASAR
jgi:TRAP-type C4-dicarboxylate transport system substrate-binding protein